MYTCLYNIEILASMYIQYMYIVLSFVLVLACTILPQLKFNLCIAVSFILRITIHVVFSFSVHVY